MPDKEAQDLSTVFYKEVSPWQKLVETFALKTGRRKRSAEKKMLGIGATKKRTASLKVVR